MFALFSQYLTDNRTELTSIFSIQSPSKDWDGYKKVTDDGPQIRETFISH